jgi:hypothetical protein
LLGARFERAAERGEVTEVLLEARGRDDLEDSAWLITGIPERVPLITGLEDKLARPSLDDVIAEQRTHPTFEDEAVLVLA